MAVVQAPIDVPDTITTIEDLISNVKLKNTTMINYYIHPNPVPTQIAEFAPRIDTLASRITSISSIDLTHTTRLINDAPAWVAHTLLPYIEQLSASVQRFQDIFIEYYDPNLRQTLPYLVLFRHLKYIEEQLAHFKTYYMTQNPNRRAAEQFYINPSTTGPSFCRSAVAFLNDQDRGRITECPPFEQVAENRARLKTHGGVILWWECPSCSFRLRFHVSNSAHLSIFLTDEVRTHDKLPTLEYRSSFLARCHLFHLGREQMMIEREVRRTTGRRNSSLPINTFGIGGVKYGCIFCYAMGTDLDVEKTCFKTAKDYAAHIVEKHGEPKTRPPGLLLQKFKVAVNGRTAEGVARWDLNFT